MSHGMVQPSEKHQAILAEMKGVLMRWHNRGVPVEEITAVGAQFLGMCVAMLPADYSPDDADALIRFNVQQGNAEAIEAAASMGITK